MNNLKIKKPFYKNPVWYIVFAIIALTIVVLIPNKKNNTIVNKEPAKVVEQASVKKNISASVKSILVSTIVVKPYVFNIKEKAIGFIYNSNINTITSEYSGFLENLTVDIGSKIVVGQKIGTIVNNDLKNNRDSLLADISKINSQIDQQKKMIDRYFELFSDGYIPQVDLENAQLQLKVLQAQLVNLNSSLKNVEVQIAKLVIVSKVSGIVQQKNFSNKDYINAGAQILQIVDNSNLMLSVSFPETYLGIIKSGQSVNIKTKEGKFLSSKILEIKPLLEESTRSLVAIAKINEKDHNLNPGSSVNVEILVKTISNAILLPEMAVVLRPSGNVVYVVTKAITDLGKNFYEVEQRVVELGESADGFVQIISGINSNDTVVVEGAGFLSNKATIRVAQ
jgi:membrane fusion protein (multidrug efflux system)